MHQPVPEEQIDEALAAWDLGPVAIEPIPRGATADVFLVTNAKERWVAKYAYDERSWFESGLAVSEVIDGFDTGFVVGTPVRTIGGELVAMVEWPRGHPHPLALLRFVSGDALPDDTASVVTMATVCGRVHRELLRVDPAQVGITVVEPNAGEGQPDNWHLGRHAWLNVVGRALAERRRLVAGAVRWGVGVWDGPDIRVDGDQVGIIDFGHTGWFPLVHVVANRSLIAAYDDRDRLDCFMGALGTELELTSAELAALDLYRLTNAVTYARWAAMQATKPIDEGGMPWLDEWLGTLVSYLGSDLPRVGLALPPAAR